MKIKIFLLLILLFSAPGAFHLFGEETGFKYFKNYTYRDYDHQPQNWAITQDKNGIIYVGNNGGVLEFDGVAWRLLNIPNNVVRSLSVADTGVIYLGGRTEFGFLTPDSKGYLNYVSLLDYVEKKQQDFSDVWFTHAIKENIYFCASKHLFRWNPNRKQMKVWDPVNSSQRFLALFNCNEELILHQQEIGLLNIKADSLEPIPGSEVFAADSIFMIVPYPSPPASLHTETSRPKLKSVNTNHIPDQTLLVGTSTRGFFLFNGMEAVPFPTGVDDLLKNTRPYYGIRLISGDFALATLRGGLIIMTADGRLKYTFNKSTGLQDDNVKYVFEDNQGNLWLGLDRGVSKLEYISPFFLYDNRSNLPGIVLSVCRHQGILYVGTTWGLFALLPGAKDFQTVPGILSNCWGLLSKGSSLLVASTDGLFQVDDKKNKKNRPRAVLPNASYSLLLSRYFPGRAWCGNRNGLTMLKQEDSGQWLEERSLESITQPIYSLAEDNNGFLWLGTYTGSVFKLELHSLSSTPRVHRYDSTRGLPEGEIHVAFSAGHVVFATGVGLFRFNDALERFVPDYTLGNEFAGSASAQPVFRLAEDKNRDIWFHSSSRNFKALHSPGGSREILSNPFRRLPIAQVNTIYPNPDGKCVWFGSFDGLICYDSSVITNCERDFPVFIREVRVNSTTPIYGGRYIDLLPHHSTGSDSTATPFSLAVIDYENRNLRFYCAAAFYEDEASTAYRYFLEGYDGDWSDWTRETQKDYTNLNAGRYRFHVQARNVYEKISPEAVFQFQVLPPWYRTWWAFLFYAAFLIAIMFLVVKWRSRKLVLEKQKLERIVVNRTREIHEKNLQLESQTLQLTEQSEKLKEMDRVKSRFFANISHEFRTPLTLIMGPLERMLERDRDQDEQKSLDIMRRNSQRLLLLINRLLDLSRFDSGKMKLKAGRRDIVPFLKGILASFELLARQKQLTLEFSNPTPRIDLYFDPEKLEEAVLNLLVNAIRNTPPGGKVSISLALTGSGDNTDCPPTEENEHINEPIDKLAPGFLEISIEDTGIGISREHLPLIFDRFFQVEDGRIDGQEGKGMGIGLALTRELVILHHGKIDVHSRTGVNSGTQFIIQLPLGANHIEPGEIVEHTPYEPGKPGSHCGFYAAIDQDAHDSLPDTAPAEDSEEEEKNVILVVEDNPDMRLYMRMALEPDYTVIEAPNGEKGISTARERIPDLIISDIMMPGIDGYELCRVLKNGIETSHIPVILLTARSSEENILQGLEIGAADYITKPFNAKILAARVKNLIELRRQFQLKIQRQRLLLPVEIPISPVDKEFLTEFQDVIKTNISDPDFDVDHLCKKLVMARSSLFKKVKALTGETPNQFIQSYRLEKAAQLLRARFGNITEVAFEVGFSSTAYFTKCFKEKFHQLPSAYQAGEAREEMEAT